MDENTDCGPMPTPSAEHAFLQESIGTWNVHCTYFMGPDQTMENEATETIEAIGPFWTVSRFEADFMGAPFVGRCTLGYMPLKERYVGTWVDSMSPHHYVMEGTYDEGASTLTMTSEGVNMQTGQPAAMRMVTTYASDDTRTFEMFMTMPDGSEMPMAAYKYTRAG